jgi:hypothetical protein
MGETLSREVAQMGKIMGLLGRALAPAKTTPIMTSLMEQIHLES